MDITHEIHKYFLLLHISQLYEIPYIILKEKKNDIMG